MTAMGQSVPTADSRSQVTALTMQTALRSHPPAATPIRKSQTTPMLSTKMSASKLDRSGSKGSAAATVVDDESKEDSEICLSPSWSEFGATKKKKEKKRWERAKKENERKERQAEELKAAKRLSKKPPAAMETQKPSSGLRRNSAISFTSSRQSSREDPRRSSRAEREISESSHQSGGKRRSQSTPATSADQSPVSWGKPGYVVGAVAPQLPTLERTPKLDTFAWHTRDSSAGTGQSNSSAGDKLYEKNLVDFAYRLEASTTAVDSWKPGLPLLKDLHASWRPDHPSFNRSQTMPDLMVREKTRLTEAKRGHRPGPQHGKETRFDGQSNPRAVYRPSMSAAATALSDQMASSGTDEQHRSEEEPPRNHRVPAKNPHQRIPPPPSTLLKDGSSYVHKQRMHQQQLSIASYQDEQAVKDANENTVPEALVEDSAEKDGPSVGTSRTISSESSRGTTRQTSLECECKLGSEGERETHLEPTEAPVKEPSDSATPTPTPTSASSSSKTDRSWNFRPFLRKNKTSGSSPTKPTGSAPIPKENVASTPKPPKPTRAGFSFQKAPKSDRMSGSARPMQAEETGGPEPVETDSVPPPELERPIVQTHSRTRTSSSQLLTDDLLNKSLRRPSTAPTLPPIDTQALMAPQPTQSEDTPDVLRPTTENVSSREDTSLPNRGKSSHPAAVTPAPNSPAVIVEGITGDGLVHKTSIKRHRSNPMLQRFAQPPTQLPSLDFLPELKHQPLVKPKRTSPIIPQFPGGLEKAPFPAVKTPMLITSSPLAQSDPGSSSSSPAKGKELHVMARSPLRVESHHPSQDGALLRPGLNSRRRTMSPAIHSTRPATMGPLSFSRGGTAEGLEAKPVAKLFVICCKCKFWHDLPSKLYELMALPQKLSRRDGTEGAGAAGALDKANQATLDTMVKCPWCEHYMTTWCCAGWTTVVYLHERHH